MKNNPPSPRQTALNCLRSWHAGRSFAETLVDRECSRAALPPADRHLVQALVFSVLRNQTWLDHVIGTLRKGKLDVEARLILQLGLSQLFLLGMADHAAVYETVNLASVRLRGLVNAILRNALRREKTILEDREQLPLPIHYSTPAWLVRRWMEQMGPQMTRDLLRWNNTTPRLYVRANPLIPMKNIPASLAPLDRAPGWFSVEGLLPLEEIKTGSLYVADPSTRYSIDLLAPQPGEEILDACAAPGGKSAAIIAATGGKALLTATDLHEHRLPTLQKVPDQQPVFLRVNGTGGINQSAARFDGVGSIFQDGLLERGQAADFFRSQAPAHIHAALDDSGVGTGNVQKHGVKAALPFRAAGKGPVRLRRPDEGGSLPVQVFLQGG